MSGDKLEQTPLVSVVVVCMNNMKNLCPCLDSIRLYTQVTYETFVVAYLFSKENLERLREEYPWVTLIESNEIRGFSENNNLALRQAKGKFCFVVNDDTEMKMPVIDMLVESFHHCPDNTAILSPNILNAKGEVAMCGRGRASWIKSLIGAWSNSIYKNPSQYTNKTGLFQSYNILGAAFLIRTDLFRMIGWFDERYFFCPEDVAVSTTLNKLGYLCYVDADVKIFHYEGMSGKSLSLIQTATKPAAMKGILIFHSDGKWYRRWMLKTNLFFALPIHFIYHYAKGCFQKRPNVNQVLAIGEMNEYKALFMNKSPKDTFIHFYNKIK